MPRYALKIEYDGRPFYGWQRQIDHPSVQGEIEAALLNLNEETTVVAAGRTDAGVHATGQTAHCDLLRDWTPFRLSEALNFHLKPHPIAIVDCSIMDDEWHARFSALERRYTYRVINRRAPITFEEGQVWSVRGKLALAPMQEAAKYLIGKHDFTTFRSTECQAKSPVKTLDEIDIEAIELASGTEFRFHLRARSFLHNQVRSLVGTLERVGAGSWTPERVKQVLEARDRSACGPVAPPFGLYMTGVEYPTPPFS